MPDFKESDLYAPVCEYFESVGYTVQAEVKNCGPCGSKGQRNDNCRA